MSPNLYDLLDVDETATEDEIRAAWRSAIAGLEPTDRRFRVYNEAAAVLLGPQQRAEYDAELAATRQDEVAAQAGGAGTSGSAAETGAADPEPGQAGTTSGDADRAAPVVRPGPANGTLFALGIAALLSVGLLVWLLTLPGTTADETPQERREQAAALRDTAASAEDAASRIIGPVLSYDHRSLDESLAEALTHLTDSYAEEHERLFSELRRQATQQEIVVTAAVARTAVSRVSEEGDLAKVVVFIDQDVRKAETEPTVLRMWVTATLVREDGVWLLDELCTEGDC